MTSESVASDMTAAGLLSRAVHRNRALSLDGALERLFTAAFSDLVYPMIWEDPRVDLAALEIEPSTRIVTIASGGCNVLNYLTADPAEVHVVDLNPSHVALTRLKLAAARHLVDHEQFLALFAKGEGAGNAEIFDRVLAHRVDADTRAYWTSADGWRRRKIDRFVRGFYRQGLLGRFITLAHGVARLYGQDPRRMMQARSRTEQVAIFEAELAPLFDRLLVRWILGHRAALYGLGIPPAQYAALLGGAGHMADVIRERLRKLACDFDIADNYFAWAAFNRGLAAVGEASLPDYLDPANFAAIKSRTDRVLVEQASFTTFLSRQPISSLDRYVLLDAQDWMSDAALTHLWSEIMRTARPGARVIFRTAGTTTILPGRVPALILDGWHYDATRSATLTKEDRSAIYGAFHLYIRNSRA
ncbi:MAG TPA: DUF3419 family protein [Hyphomicrobiaceae bacterium]|nr:DUF3419 family protein [Hyphomicrobiaceae bacterium]